jgi:uncharacterized protein GlcG (DUF336 family)
VHRCRRPFFTGSSVSNEPVLTEKNISIEMAMTAYKGTVEECEKSNSNDISVAIVDRAGQVSLLARGDNAAPHNLELARRKAYTARTFRTTSLAWRDRTAGGSPYAAQRQLVDVIALGGGVPIMIGDNVIGAVGVSGSNGGQTCDEACAKGGVAAIADQLH